MKLLYPLSKISFMCPNGTLSHSKMYFFQLSVENILLHLIGMACHVFSTIISNNQPRANKKQVSVQRKMIIQRYVGLTKHLAQVCCRRLLFVLPCLHPNTEATSYSERVPPELVGEVILLGVVVPVVLPHVHCGVLNTLCLSIWERAS